MAKLLKGWVRWIKEVSGSMVARDILLEFSEPLACVSADDGSESETRFVILRDFMMFGHYIFIGSDAEGKVSRNAVVPLGGQKVFTDNHTQSIIQQVTEVLAGLGYGLDIENSFITKEGAEDCTCGECTPEDIEETREARARVLAAMRAKGVVWEGEAPKPKTVRVTKENHPENRLATDATETPMPMPADPFGDIEADN